MTVPSFRASHKYIPEHTQPTQSIVCFQHNEKPATEITKFPHNVGTVFRRVAKMRQRSYNRGGFDVNPLVGTAVFAGKKRCPNRFRTNLLDLFKLRPLSLVGLVMRDEFRRLWIGWEKRHIVPLIILVNTCLRSLFPFFPITSIVSDESMALERNQQRTWKSLSYFFYY